MPSRSCWRPRFVLPLFVGSRGSFAVVHIEFASACLLQSNRQVSHEVASVSVFFGGSFRASVSTVSAVRRGTEIDGSSGQSANASLLKSTRRHPGWKVTAESDEHPAKARR
jgi:hypothetical protein